MNPGYDTVDALVRQLWPPYKASIQPMWDYKLFQYSADVLSETLRRYRAEYPDDTKPTWKTIYTMLSGGNTGSSRSDLWILLDGMRREIRSSDYWARDAAARARAMAWSDSEVFENHIEANTRPILRRMDGKAEDDPDGRLGRLAATTRANMVARYTRDLEERGERVPAWLVR